MTERRAPQSEMSPLTELFKQLGAYKDGHTAYENGLHGNGFFEKMEILRDPANLDEVTRILADRLRERFGGCDYVVGPANMGSTIAAFTALHMRTRFTSTYIENRSDHSGFGNTFFHRNAVPNRSSKIIIVDDTLATGKTITRNFEFIAAQGMEIAGIGLFCVKPDFDPSQYVWGEKCLYLDKSPYWQTAKKKCQLCASGSPIVYQHIRE